MAAYAISAVARSFEEIAMPARHAHREPSCNRERGGGRRERQRREEGEREGGKRREERETEKGGGRERARKEKGGEREREVREGEGRKEREEERESTKRGDVSWEERRDYSP